MSQNTIERVECPGCRQVVGEHHLPDCIGASAVIEWMGRPSSFVIRDIAVVAHYELVSEAAWTPAMGDMT